MSSPSFPGAFPGPGPVRRRGRKDPHGRVLRGPLAWPAVPIMTSRSADFDDLVLETFERLDRRAGGRLAAVEVAVEDVPPSDPTSWENAIPLGRLFPAQGREPARVVIYRRPVASRAHDAPEMASLVTAVLAEQAAGLLGVPLEELDED